MLSDFPFFTANYGESSAYSCMTNVLHYLAGIKKSAKKREQKMREQRI